MYQILCCCLPKYCLLEGLSLLIWDSLRCALASPSPLRFRQLRGSAPLEKSGVIHAQQDLSRKHIYDLVNDTGAGKGPGKETGGALGVWNPLGGMCRVCENTAAVRERLLGQ